MKNLFKNKVLQNSIYLYILQIFSTVIPLITLPYITRVLGIEKYGVFSKMLNYITYLQVFVEYGFTLTGASKISLAQNQEEINKVFSNIIVCKIINCLISLIIIFCLGFTLFYNSGQWKCLFILALLCLSEVFIQTWMLQGLQDMKFIMIINVLARCFSTVLIFIFVKTTNDLLLYSFLFVATNIIVAVFGLLLVTKKFQVRFVKTNIKEIVLEFRDGWYLFTTSFASKICSNIAITVLGIFTTDIIIGGYSAVLKIPQIIVMVYAPLGQAIYPYMCKNFKQDKFKAVNFIKKLFLVILIGCLIGLFVLIGLRDFIINIVYGEEYIAYAYLTIPLGIWLVCSILNNVLGIQILVASGNQKIYSRCFLISVVALVGLNFLLGYFFGAIGVAYATMIGEAILTVCCAITIWLKKLLFKTENINIIEEKQI